MKYEGIVKVSMHHEFPVGRKVVGLKMEDEPLITGADLSWLRVKLSNGVNRDILVTSLRPVDE